MAPILSFVQLGLSTRLTLSRRLINLAPFTCFQSYEVSELGLLKNAKFENGSQ